MPMFCRPPPTRRPSVRLGGNCKRFYSFSSSARAEVRPKCVPALLWPEICPGPALLWPFVIAGLNRQAVRAAAVHHLQRSCGTSGSPCRGLGNGW